MSLEVEILNVEDLGSEIDATVSVKTDTVQTIDYELDIYDPGMTSDTVTIEDTVVGGAGSYRGDANIHDAIMTVGDNNGGTVVANAKNLSNGDLTIAKREWGAQDNENDPLPSRVDLTSCSADPTSNGNLSVSYSLAPRESAGVEVDVSIRVDSQAVGTYTHFVPLRGGGFSQTIPARELPIGEEMPVELNVDGEIQDCGTVSVADPDAEPEPEPEPTNVRLTGCEVVSEDPLQVRFTIDGDGSRGSATVRLMVDGQQVASKQVDYTLNPVDRVVEAPVSDLPLGEDMPVSVGL